MVMVVLLVITYQGGRIKPAARQLCEEQDERQLHWELHQEGMGLETGGLGDNSVQCTLYFTLITYVELIFRWNQILCRFQFLGGF